ncbi:MAG: DNA-3-methyladenine glycosylase 2 family protein [Blastocatellia bacterium]|nr:DNA-3-methyladenine glycosylase 2 family protein [Blastocatellia bacterium]
MSKIDDFVQELQRAERTLARRDPQMRALIKRYGSCAIRPHTRYFETLVGSVISQQLSTKAADTIFKRFKALYAPARFPKPEQILATPDADLRGVGMSGSKVSFVKDLVVKTQDGVVKFNRLSRLSDDEIIDMLAQVKGIGVWTVHMFLIFSLGRLNVLPVGDLGIRRGVERLYGFDDLPVADQVETVARENGWHPYCSVASWFLWRSLENKADSE